VQGLDEIVVVLYSSYMNSELHQVEAKADSGELLLFRILDAAEEVESRLEAEFAKVGLSGAKASVLHALGQAAEPLSLSEVADENSCVRSNITQLVDRLEADGLVRRVNDPNDRRIRRAALTVAGHKAYGDAMMVIASQEQALQELLTTDETRMLSRVLEKLSE
jgi:DNA-binding MarR family transcriptional regulator